MAKSRRLRIQCVNHVFPLTLTVDQGKVAGPNGAAAKLGIPRSTLDLKIKQLSIKKNGVR